MCLAIISSPLAKEAGRASRDRQPVPAGFAGAVDARHGAAGLVAPNSVCGNMVAAGRRTPPGRFDAGPEALAHSCDVRLLEPPGPGRPRTSYRHAAVALKTGQMWQHSVVPFLNTRLLRAPYGCARWPVNALRIVKRDIRQCVFKLRVTGISLVRITLIYRAFKHNRDKSGLARRGIYVRGFPGY